MNDKISSMDECKISMFNYYKNLNLHESLMMMIQRPHKIQNNLLDIKHKLSFLWGRKNGLYHGYIKKAHFSENITRNLIIKPEVLNRLKHYQN